MNKKPQFWYGVDMDRTLVEYHKYSGPEELGAPILAMVNRVKEWLAEGEVEIRIFTARVYLPPNPNQRDIEYQLLAHTAIEAFCMEQFGQRLAITCQKDSHCLRLYDDIARQVEPNTGRLIDGSIVL